MTKALPVPVTGKIRLGWDDSSLNYLEVAKTIQDNGGSLVAVHGRTRVQGYTGTARWEPIAEIKRALTIPVIANGDITTVADVNQVLQTTGADAVMIGRAALENPWIFAGLERHQIPPAAVRQLLMTHYNAMLEYYGVERGNILYRKYAKRLLQPYEPDRDELTSLLTAETTQIFQQRLNTFFDRYLLQPIQS